jgi:SOS response regulatory protein OraA/RecX
MEICTLRKSAVDPEFFEILSNGVVVQEVKISFRLYRIPKNFDSVKEVLSWIDETGTKLAKASAYRMLGRKSYSKASLLRKLIEKGFPSTVCQKIIEDLEKFGYLSDNDFAERIILQKIRQGYGPYYIEQYIKQQGMNPSLVRKMINEKTQKEALAKWTTKLKLKEKKKQIAFLVRKGFDFSVCRDFIDLMGR